MASGVARLAAQLGILPLRRRLIAYLCQIARTDNVEEIQSLGNELQSRELADAASSVILRKSEALAPAFAASGAISSAACPISASIPEAKRVLPAPILNSLCLSIFTIESHKTMDF
jgi:hypothetical protein